MLYLNSRENKKEIQIMTDKKADVALLILLFMPIIMAIGGLLVNFDVSDLFYLSVLVILFSQYYHKIKA